METLIIYISKVGIYITIFWLIYLVLMQKTTFFRFNRIYLIWGVIASFTLPLINYRYDVYIPISEFVTDINATTTPENIEKDMNIWNILGVFYIIGTFVIICRSIYSIIKFRKEIKNKKITLINKYKIIDDQSVEVPFSVINYIFINSHILTKDEYDLILKHEKAHVDQYHWIDLIISEIMIATQWFNPIAWQYIKRQKENHEFLADQFVIDTGISPALYRAILINQQLQGPIFSFSNSFNVIKPLNRLKMITKTRTSPWRKLTALVVLPLIGAFVWVSAKPNYVYEIENNKLSADTTKTKIHVFTINDDSLAKGESGEYKISIQDADSEKSNIKITSTKIDGLNLTVDKSNDAVQTHRLDVTSDSKKGIKLISTNGDSKPLIIVDGEEQSNDILKSLDPKQIEKIEVLKGESATEKYGEKAKDGAILITTKK